MGGMRRSFANRSPQSLLPAKTKLYEQNGSGRDTYIMRSSGGFYAEFPQISPREYHMKTLRNYENSLP